MSKTRVHRPYFVKVAEAPPWAKEVHHRISCDGDCGVENMSGRELRDNNNNPVSCWVGVSRNYMSTRGGYDKGTVGKWGVKVEVRRARAKLRDAMKLAARQEDPETPEPYRTRNTNKWNMS